MRRAAFGATGVAAVAAMASLEGNAAGASVTQGAPAAGAEVYPVAGTTAVLRWRSELTGCPNPVSQRVAVARASGTNLVGLIGPAPAPGVDRTGGCRPATLNFNTIAVRR